MTFDKQPFIGETAAKPVSDRYLADEESLVATLCDAADTGSNARAKIGDTAAGLVRSVRKNAVRDGGIEAFLQQYDLSSEEGVLLMCVAEALLRIPDGNTADRLIADKITSANWEEHLGESDSLFVNASTWGLMLTGKLLTLDEAARGSPAKYLGKLASHQIYGATGFRMNNDPDRLRREISPRNDRVHPNQSDNDENKQRSFHSYHLP